MIMSLPGNRGASGPAASTVSASTLGASLGGSALGTSDLGASDLGASELGASDLGAVSSCSDAILGDSMPAAACAVTGSLCVDTSEESAPFASEAVSVLFGS